MSLQMCAVWDNPDERCVLQTATIDSRSMIAAVQTQRDEKERKSHESYCPALEDPFNSHTEVVESNTLTSGCLPNWSSNCSGSWTNCLQRFGDSWTSWFSHQNDKSLRTVFDKVDAALSAVCFPVRAIVEHWIPFLVSCRTLQNFRTSILWKAIAGWLDGLWNTPQIKLWQLLVGFSVERLVWWKHVTTEWLKCVITFLSHQSSAAEGS